MLRIVVIDVSKATGKRELHELLAEKLSFPPFYGKNWDAFWDTITGLVEMPEVLEIRGLEHLKKALPKEAFHLINCLSNLGEDHPEINCKVRYA